MSHAESRFQAGKMVEETIGELELVVRFAPLEPCGSPVCPCAFRPMHLLFAGGVPFKDGIRPWLGMFVSEDPIETVTERFAYRDDALEQSVILATAATLVGTSWNTVEANPMEVLAHSGAALAMLQPDALRMGMEPAARMRFFMVDRGDPRALAELVRHSWQAAYGFTS